MGIEEGDTGANTSAVSMDDLKKLKATLTTSMETQMKEMREMMAQILQASKAPAFPTPEDSASAAKVKLRLNPMRIRLGKELVKNPYLKVTMGKRGTMIFLIGTPPTHPSLILI